MMKNILLTIVAGSVAMALDAVRGSLGGSIIPPLTVGAVCYLLWQFTLGQRLAIAFVLGSLADIFGFLPIGTHTIIFLCAAYACAPMKSFFSNTDSHVVVALNVAILIVLFRLLVAPVSSLVALSASLL